MVYWYKIVQIVLYKRTGVELVPCSLFFAASLLRLVLASSSPRPRLSAPLAASTNASYINVQRSLCYIFPCSLLEPWLDKRVVGGVEVRSRRERLGGWIVRFRVRWCKRAGVWKGRFARGYICRAMRPVSQRG